MVLLMLMLMLLGCEEQCEPLEDKACVGELTVELCCTAGDCLYRFSNDVEIGCGGNACNELEDDRMIYYCLNGVKQPKPDGGGGGAGGGGGCIPEWQCCKVCSSGRACGDSCISSDSDCHQSSGCACNSWEVC